MAPTIIIILIAVIAVGFFTVGLSLTLIFKGRNLQSEVGENDDMKRLGIKCTAQQVMEDEAELRGKEKPLSNCDTSSCGNCSFLCK